MRSRRQCSCLAAAHVEPQAIHFQGVIAGTSPRRRLTDTPQNSMGRALRRPRAPFVSPPKENFRDLGERGFVIGSGAGTMPGADEAISAFAADATDETSLTLERSVLSWPTPFGFNFMTGRSPAWRRHLYFRLSVMSESL
jgi:hypothetical protein